MKGQASSVRGGNYPDLNTSVSRGSSITEEDITKDDDPLTEAGDVGTETMSVSSSHVTWADITYDGTD